jgi:ketosteroid isomerase-like protein
MPSFLYKSFVAVATCVILTGLPALSCADDQLQLKKQLTEFLQGVDDKAQHDSFWAEDLIYTSSSGERFGKAKIMEGLTTSADVAPDPTRSNRYSAEDVTVRLYGDTAIVAFRLLNKITDAGASQTQQYYNTGTFLKRNARWQVVAWHVTKIPAP